VNFIDVISGFYIFISLLFIRFLVFDMAGLTGLKPSLLCLLSLSRNSVDNSNSHREVWRGKECAKHTLTSVFLDVNFHFISFFTQLEGIAYMQSCPIFLMCGCVIGQEAGFNVLHDMFYTSL